MGCGKTTLANYLAKSLQREWIDLDVWIEKETGTKIAHIFEEKGEVYFRKLEEELLFKIHQSKNKIVSTGGGIIGSETNRKLLKEGICIYLDWPFPELYRRIAGDASRPLVKSYDQLQELYNRRRSLYEESCTLHIKCENETPYSLNQYILEHLDIK